MSIKNIVMIIVLVASLTGCASTEPPRDVSTISSSKTKTLTAPKITQSDADGFLITYAEMSMGYDASCNPFKGFSDELNQCSELPENVKVIAIDHCKNQGQKAVFLGNTTNFLKMTVSKFSCEEKDS